jgi:integrase
VEKGIYSGSLPKFECIDPKNLASLPRDGCEDEELLALLKLPLFTCCKNGLHVRQRGNCFVQSAIYRGFLICIFSGMRPGEVGQLKCSQVRTDGTFYYFDLRKFDASSGRVPLEELSALKSEAAGRVIPIHPILIELGLIDRLTELENLGEERLFLEWKARAER